MPSVARHYHEATKHSYESVRRRGRLLDWSNKPHPFKVYEGLPRIPLPRRMPAPGVPALDALSGSGAHQAGPLHAADLATLLFLGAGVHQARDSGGGDRMYFRTYASAGALYPVEVYLACGEVEGLEGGLYHFDPLEFALTRLRAGDPRAALVRAAAGQPAVSRARVVLVMTGIPWRTAWKYAERGYRHLFWDAGMILANVLAVAEATDQPATVVVGFDDGEVETVLGVDGRREFPLCLVALAGGDEPIEPAMDPPPAIEPSVRPLSAREYEFELIREANDAGRLVASEVEAWRSWGGGLTTSARGIVPDWEMPEDLLEEVIRRRGSARVFSRGSMPLRDLQASLGLAILGMKTDHGAMVIEPYAIVNAVEGLDPGAYAYRTGRFELLAAGEYRREAGYLCLEQRLAADAAATIFLMADLGRVLDAMGDRGYRAAQLEAGIVAGRIYLAAYAYMFGATGLTFYDDDVTEFFSPDAAGKSCMLVVAVGDSPRLARKPRER